MPMQRQTLSPEAEAFVTAKRAEHHSLAATEDQALDPKDRRDREHVVSPLCRIQRDDDIMYQGYPHRVIGPARAEGWLICLQEAPWGFMDVSLDAGNTTDREFITDRAPADPNEEPLPIFIEPEQEEEP